MLSSLQSTFKNSIIYGIGNMSIKVIGLILFPIYTKELSISDYGVLGMLEVTSQIVIAIFSFNIQAALLRLYFNKEYKGKQGSMIFSTLAFLSLSVVLMICFITPLSGFLSEKLLHSGDYAKLIKVMILASGIQIINTVPSTLLRLLENAKLYSIAMVVRLLLTLLLTIYLVVNLQKGIEGIFIGQIAGHIVFFAVVAVVLLRNIKLEFDKRIILAMLAFSLPLVFSSVANVLLSVVDRYSLSFMGDMADVGVYSAGFKIANTLLMVFSSFQLAITPVIYKKINDPDNLRFYSKIFTYMAFGGMILVLGMSMFGKEIIKFLALDPDYWAGYKIIPIIAYGLFFNNLRYFATTGLNIAMKTKTIALLTVLVALLNIGLNILFIKQFGYIGAAVATLISHIVFSILIYRRAQKTYPVPYELNKVYLVIIVSLIILPISFLTNDFSLLWRIIAKSGLIMLFPVILYFFNFYEKIELERIKQFFRAAATRLLFKKGSR
jgi:O-antigen/teichoic acid export membrane protein